MPSMNMFKMCYITVKAVMLTLMVVKKRINISGVSVANNFLRWEKKVPNFMAN